MPALRFLATTMSLLALCAVRQAQQVIPLWEKGAPGFEARRAEPERHSPQRLAEWLLDRGLTKRAP